jgi:L-lactate dehydrogenase (cytochrome)
MGGRQLDGAPSSISVLPEIVQAVDGRCEVYMDGGVQSGQDVLKALALGARGCLIGKAFLYGLAAMGGAGVTKVLQIIRSQLAVSMALTGQTSVQSVSADVLRNPPEGVRRFSDHESLRVVRSDGDSGLRRPAP